MPSQNGIAALNRGSNRQTCTIPAGNTINNLQIEQWSNGRRTRTGVMRDVVIVMGHFRGQKRNPRANVHIQTAFPRF